MCLCVWVRAREYQLAVEFGQLFSFAVPPQQPSALVCLAVINLLSDFEFAVNRKCARAGRVGQVAISELAAIRRTESFLKDLSRAGAGGGGKSILS